MSFFYFQVIISIFDSIISAVYLATTEIMEPILKKLINFVGKYHYFR